MFSPVDDHMINSMVSYRQQEIHSLCEPKRRQPDALVVVRPTRTQGLLGSFRQSFGLFLIRLGARLAGLRMHTRIGTQS
jgi:hypothetical protein